MAGILPAITSTTANIISKKTSPSSDSTTDISGEDKILPWKRRLTPPEPVTPDSTTDIEILPWKRRLTPPEPVTPHSIADQPFNISLDWSNYLPNLNKTKMELQQSEAITGLKYSPAVAGGMYEGAIKAGSEQAAQDVLSSKQEALGRAQLKLSERGVEAQENADSGGGTIICGELNRQGHMSNELLRLDGQYRELHIADDAYRGYLKLAAPVVALMQRSKIITWMIKPFALKWAEEMASRLETENYKGNTTGKILLKIGIPICRYFAPERRANIWAA